MLWNAGRSDTCSNNNQRHTCERKCYLAKHAEQNGNFIMIAAGISGHNYQRWLIHSLIASFNLFTFGAEQCQPAADENNLLWVRGTYTSELRLFVPVFMTGALWSHSKSLQPHNGVQWLQNWTWGSWQIIGKQTGKSIRGCWEQIHSTTDPCSKASRLPTRTLNL